jgi:hypothetical protein
LDEQHDWFCVPISLAGSLFVCLLLCSWLLILICLPFSSTSDFVFLLCFQVHPWVHKQSRWTHQGKTWGS